MAKRRLLATLFVTFACSLPALSQGAATSPLPTAKEVVERYDLALGGRDAIMRHTSSTMRGSTEIHRHGDVRTLAFVYFAGAPYLRLERTTLPDGTGDVLSGFDGETAWGLHPKLGPEVLSGNDRESAKRDADFYYPLNELSWFKSMETVGIEDFEGRPCYRLHGINNWDKSNDHLYDKETGLLAAYEFNSDLGLTHEIFTDYKKVDGVLFPMKQVVKVKSKEGDDWTVVQVLDFKSVTFNDVDPAVFAPPQAVRDLSPKTKQDAAH
jgi:hypothetical protein